MGLLMFGNVEGTSCGQTGAGGWAGRLDGWVDEAGKTHLWRGVLEPWSCYGVDIENLFCLGLRRVGFHLGEKEWQNRKILFGRQSVSLSALPSQEWIWKGGQVGMAMRSVWGWGEESVHVCVCREGRGLWCCEALICYKDIFVFPLH